MTRDEGPSLSGDEATPDLRRGEAPLPPLEAGTFIGRYVVTGTAGEGGMGVVYRAYDPRLRREVALKRLRPRGKKGELDATSKARLLAEARAMASLSHPNVLPVYDVEELDGDLCVTMEHVEGVTLRQWRRTHEPKWHHALDVLLKAGHGLAAAHRAGLVHRDFKPSNVMVGRDGQVRVMDFGLATRRSDSESASLVGLASVSSSATVDEPEGEDPKTEAGMVMGTPAYMAPEQHDGSGADARSDQFAFCVSAYEVLFGRRPFAARGAKALAIAKREGRVRRTPPASGVPRSILRIIVRGMARHPSNRWPSMDVLLAKLHRAQARRRLRPFLLAGGVAVAAAAGLALRPASACGVDQRLAEVWSPARAEATAAALRATGVRAADAQWPELQRRIDAYAESWASLYAEACTQGRRGQHPDTISERQMLCLHERLGSLDAAITVLQDADAELAPRAPRVLDGLPAVEPCGDSAYLLSSVAPPADPAVADDVEQIRRQAMRAEALALAGRGRDAARILTGLEASARHTGDGPIIARVVGGLASSLVELGDEVEAESLAREAFFLAVGHRDDEAAIRSALVSAHVVGDRLHRPADGLLWVDHAEALVERAGLPIQWKGRVAYARGSVLHTQGELAGARESLLEALTLLGSDHEGRTAFYRAAAHNNLGLVYLDLGQLREALAEFTASHRIHETAYGGGHPAAATALMNVATTRARLGHTDEALDDLHRALDQYEAGFGPDSALALLARGNVAQLLAILGRYDEADAWYARLEEGYDRTGRLRTVAGARMLAARAEVAAEAGRTDEARQRWERAVNVLSGVTGDTSVSTIEARLQYGRFLLDQGNAGPAERQLERAEAGAAVRLADAHPLRVDIEGSQAHALLLRGDAEAALAKLEPLVVRAEANPDVQIDTKAWLRLLLADALWTARSEHRARAWALAIEVRDELRQRPERSPELVDEVVNWLDGRAKPGDPARRN